MNPSSKTKSNHKISTGPCVYILRCGDNTLYTGWTNNFEKRLFAHKNGKGAKYTKGRGPLSPVYLEFMPDRSASAKREYEIKKLSRDEKLKLIASSSNQLPKIPHNLQK